MKKITLNSDLIMEWGLLLSIALMPVGRAMTAISGGIGTVIWIFKRIREKKFKPPKNPLNLPLLFLFFAMLISSFFSMSYERSFNKTFVYSLYFFYFFAIVDTFTDEEKIMKLYWSMAVCAVLISFDGLFQYLVGFDLIKLQKYDGGQVDASFGNKSFGSFLCVLVPFVLAFIEFKKKRIVQIFFYVCMAVTMVVLILTGSRSAMIGVMAAIVLMGIFATNKKRVISAVVALAIVLTGILTFSSGSIVARTKDLLHPFESQKGERMILWSAALRMFKDSPVVGQGTDSYRIAYQKFKKDYGIMTGAMHPHNIYLQVLSETGLIGIMALFSIIFSSAMMLWFIVRNKNSENQNVLALAVLGSFTSYFTSSLGNQSLFVSWWAVMMWYVLAMITAAYNFMKNSTLKA